MASPSWTYGRCCGEWVNTGTCVLCNTVGCSVGEGMSVYWMKSTAAAILTCRSCRDIHGDGPCDFCSRCDIAPMLELRFSPNPKPPAAVGAAAADNNSDDDTAEAEVGRRKTKKRKRHPLVPATLMFNGQKHTLCTDCREHGDACITCVACDKDMTLAGAMQQPCCPNLVCKSCYRNSKRRCVRQKKRRNAKTQSTTANPECSICCQQERCLTCANYHPSEEMRWDATPCLTCPAWRKTTSELLGAHVIDDLLAVVMRYLDDGV